MVTSRILGRYSSPVISARWGIRLSPFGSVQPEQAHQAFCEQIDALVKSGVDLIIIETMTDLYEIHEASRQLETWLHNYQSSHR